MIERITCTKSNIQHRLTGGSETISCFLPFRASGSERLELNRTAKNSYTSIEHPLVVVAANPCVLYIHHAFDHVPSSPTQTVRLGPFCQAVIANGRFENVREKEKADFRQMCMEILHRSL